jgi:hypothetical protein
MTDLFIEVHHDFSAEGHIPANVTTGIALRGINREVLVPKPDGPRPQPNKPGIETTEKHI